MDALRTNIKESLQSDETNRYNNKYIESLIELVVADATVLYPPVAVEDEINRVIQTFEERLKRDQMDLETYLKTRNMTREEFAEKEASQVAERNLKRNLVLEEFAVREQIQITNEEVQMIMNMAENQARQDPSLKTLARGGVTKKQVADNLARSTINEIFNQRMMNRLRDIASGKADAPAEEPVAEIAADVVAEAQPETSAVSSEPVEAASEETPKAEE
jgi:trigger factor